MDAGASAFERMGGETLPYNMEPSVLALRIGQVIGVPVLLIGLVGVSLHLILVGALVTFGTEWVIRKRPDWIGLNRKDDT